MKKRHGSVFVFVSLGMCVCVRKRERESMGEREFRFAAMLRTTKHLAGCSDGVLFVYG